MLLLGFAKASRSAPGDKLRCVQLPSGVLVQLLFVGCPGSAERAARHDLAVRAAAAGLLTSAPHGLCRTCRMRCEGRSGRLCSCR